MYYPNLESFTEKTKKGNLIPVYKEILADMETPVSAYYKIRGGEYSFLLESVEGGEKWGQFSFLGCDPQIIISSSGGNTTVEEGSRTTSIEGNPLEAVKEVMSRYRVVEDPNLPRFFGGAVGYLSYDMARYFEKLPRQEKSSLGLADLVFMITDTILIFDNLTHKIKVVSNAFIRKEDKDIEGAYKKAIHKIDKLISRLKNRSTGTVGELNPQTAGMESDTETLSNFTRNEFQDAVRKAKEYIAAGDAFQIVLSQRFEKRISTDPFNIYRALRVVNPSPYMYCFHLKDVDLLGSSPEILVRGEGSEITVKPIAGTRKRGSGPEEDKKLARELTADEKERAEHIMLVDLGRNDVGRVAKVGSIQVEDMMEVEKFSHVMHMTTQVKGRLAEGKNCYDLLMACFPAGTVSGAPKVRAMEIIEELENTHRGPYAGAVGYFSFTGNVDTCINIRGIIIKDGVAFIQAGAGIVADSEPENEFVETENKSRAMLAAINMAENGLF